MTRGLWRALVLSLLLHTLLFLPARRLPWLPEFSGRSAGATIAASLRPVARAQPAALSSESSLLLDEKPPSKNEMMTGDAGKVVTPVSRGFASSTATDNVAVVSQGAAAPARTAAPPVAVAAPGEPVALDGVRQYRLNLAREARQAKIYPGIARERGWEGVVVVVLTTVAGVPVPQVTISQSSGIEILDRAATELVELAVQTARMPESLRDQQFALTLPIHYRLADD